jgi:hypothetical protein
MLSSLPYDVPSAFRNVRETRGAVLGKSCQVSSAHDAVRGRKCYMKTSLLWIFEALFGCHHQQLSRVFTIQQRTYQVCVVCGREFEYSWEMMHPVRSRVAESGYAPPNILTQTETAAS